MAPKVLPNGNTLTTGRVDKTFPPDFVMEKDLGTSTQQHEALFIPKTMYQDEAMAKFNWYMSNLIGSRYDSVLNKVNQALKGRTIDESVCLGLGPFIKEWVFDPKKDPLKRGLKKMEALNDSLCQLALFFKTLSSLKSHGHNIKRVYVQDPLFKTGDINLLKGLGFEASTSNQKKLITNETFLFAIRMDVPKLIDSLEHAKPVLYIGTEFKYLLEYSQKPNVNHHIKMKKNAIDVTNDLVNTMGRLTLPGYFNRDWDSGKIAIEYPKTSKQQISSETGESSKSQGRGKVSNPCYPFYLSTSAFSRLCDTIQAILYQVYVYDINSNLFIFQGDPVADQSIFHPEMTEPRRLLPIRIGRNDD